MHAWPDGASARADEWPRVKRLAHDRKWSLQVFIREPCAIDALEQRLVVAKRRGVRHVERGARTDLARLCAQPDREDEKARARKGPAGPYLFGACRQSIADGTSRQVAGRQPELLSR